MYCGSQKRKNSVNMLRDKDNGNSNTDHKGGCLVVTSRVIESSGLAFDKGYN